MCSWTCAQVAAERQSTTPQIERLQREQEAFKARADAERRRLQELEKQAEQLEAKVRTPLTTAHTSNRVLIDVHQACPEPNRWMPNGSEKPALGHYPTFPYATEHSTLGGRRNDARTMN